MLMEWRRVWQARQLMKKNEGFLPSWHAYVGFKLHLFDELSQGVKMQTFIETSAYDATLLRNWVETGLVLGHLKLDRKQMLLPSKHAATYYSHQSPYSIGELLREMMELHLPTLLHYPHLMQSGQEKLIYRHEDFGQTVAETSAMIEKLAIREVMQWMKRHQPNNILDVGCGHAGYLIQLSKKYLTKQFTGIDVNPQVVQAAQQKVQHQNIQNVRILEQDISSLPASEATYDQIMMNNILHYFSPQQRQQLFAWSREQLQHNGTLTVISPIYDKNQGSVFSAAFNNFMSAHQNLYSLPTQEEIVQYSKSSGYRVERMTPVVKEGAWYFIGLRKIA